MSTDLPSNPVTHEFRDGYIRAKAHPGECVIIEANDAETGDDAEVCLDIVEAQAFHVWLGRVLGVPETGARRPGRIHINGFQLKHALDFVDQDDESEIVIEHVDFARPDGNSPSETMPPGLYAWFREYPDEGSLLLPESAPKSGADPFSDLPREDA